MQKVMYFIGASCIIFEDITVLTVLNNTKELSINNASI